MDLNLNQRLNSQKKNNFSRNCGLLIHKLVLHTFVADEYIIHK